MQASFQRIKRELRSLLKGKKENLVIKVKDDGIGIPRSEWDKIFEKF